MNRTIKSRIRAASKKARKAITRESSTSRTLEVSAPPEFRIKNTLLRVLSISEEGQWRAICLDMDLEGFGETQTEALDELEEMIKEQVSFAAWKKDPDLIFRQAESKYVLLYEQARSEALRREVLHSEWDDSELGAVAEAMAIPGELVAAFQKDKGASKAQRA